MSTIKQVAARAGVSFTTVSHVVNRTRPVSDAARVRVERAIAELGYFPSAVARALKTSQTRILGVIVPNITNPFFSELTRGVEDVCERSGYSVFLCNGDDDRERQGRSLDTLLERRVDGVLLATPTGPATALARHLSGMKLKTVVVDRSVPGLEADRVRIDHQAGGRLAVEHLLALGHRRIACLAGPSGFAVSRARVAGWRKALTRAGIEPREEWLLEGDFRADGGHELTRRLLVRRGAPPTGTESNAITAIFASNDLMGIGALRAAGERGCPVPRALSIIGFDGIEMGAFTYPALTTVGYPIRALGETAATVLIDRIAGRRTEISDVLVAPTVIRRESHRARAMNAVRMTGIHKHFGAVRANDGVDLTVAAGTVHALVGENGAGKSTLMSQLYGHFAPDSGTIEVFGKRATLKTTHDAIALGLGIVHQHFMLVDTLTALENVILGAEPGFLLRRAEAAVRPRLQELMASTGLRVDLDARSGSLPVGDRQRLEILKVLFRGARVLILDEPTAVLTPQETLHLFEVLARLRAQGTTIILITHKLDEVMRLADRVTVMRGGQVVRECAIAETTPAQLAEAMVGRKVNIGRPAAATAGEGDLVLEARGLKVRDAMGVTRLHGIDLQLRAGQIVGIAGVSGNGQSELLEVLSGLRVPQEGVMTLAGETFSPARWLTPRTARRLRLAHVPEDRHARAMVMDFPAWESGVLGYEGQPVYSGGGFLRLRRMRGDTGEMMERFDVRPRAPELTSGRFSGGNQQKLVLARELGQGPRVLLAGQPTRGVDIGAIEFIHGQLRALRAAGCAIIVVSSEIEEILALADRVIVMNAGRVTGERPVESCTAEELGLLMAQTDHPRREKAA